LVHKKDPAVGKRNLFKSVAAMTINGKFRPLITLLSDPVISDHIIRRVTATTAEKIEQSNAKEAGMPL
jgi:hypothetical protein